MKLEGFEVPQEADPFYAEMLDEVGGLAKPNNLALAAAAASCLEPGESYVEVGSFKGASLIAASRAWDGDVVAIDDFSMDEGSRERLERNLARLALSDLEVVRCASSAAAVQGADIITTVTADKRNATILTPEMITGGVHVNAVGGDCPGKTELHPDILSRADVRVVVEYGPQTRIEGEIQQMPADFPVIELAQVLAGRAPGRAGEREVTIFDSVGFALEDFSALRYLLRIHHEERGGEQQIDLLPDLEDPKDLFGVLAGEPEPLAAERGVAA